jgi:cation diffusion facilitator CzcD-associated flavoprotein CzcO
MAQDLHAAGAEAVTMVQRGATAVISLEPSGTQHFAVYQSGSVEDVDLMLASLPYPVLQSSYQALTRRTCAFDADLLERLHRAGFRTDFEDDETGFHMKYLRTGGGYYINVGCSDLIADGLIDVVPADGVETFTAKGMQLRDGTHIDADLVALATGYENMQEAIRRFLGDAVADAVGPVWGFDADGFMRNMWQRTAQPGFWVMGGGLNECRIYSRFLALQIAAELQDLAPTDTTHDRDREHS